MYDFEKLETLNMSYNSITPASIRQLYNLRRLKTLDLQANNLVTLPEDIRLFESLEELNLSSNQFASASTLVDPGLIFKAIG
jgi:Leucine-rich repeat (LRR) protein